MSHKEKKNLFTQIFGIGTIALLGLVAVTTFAPANSNLSTASLLSSLTSLSIKAGTTVNLSAATGAINKAVSSVSPSPKSTPSPAVNVSTSTPKATKGSVATP